jgi:iron complex transport system permease protein
VVALAVSVLLGVRFGSVPVSTADVLAVLSGGGDPATRDIVLQLRLPRVLLALLVGGGLAIAGATFQALLRNPLAEVSWAKNSRRPNRRFTVTSN